MVNDYVFHREVYATLHRVLTEDVAGPFRFLDLACGDAAGWSVRCRARGSATITAWICPAGAGHGARVLEALDCPVELDQRDFMAAMADRPEPADVVWIGLSLHHLAAADKLILMREVRAVVGGKGGS